ncbi:MAG: ATP-binding protein [Aquificae bacterium]|nr:ATP-binding protein [Aquificota bacterium]
MFPKHILEKIDILLDRYISTDIDLNLEENYAFIFEENLKPIKNFVKVDLNDLIGIEDQKEKLLKNTQRFLKGKPANNVLLWGEKGTGKSSLIKGMLNLYYSQGLRMIQVLKHNILSIFDLFDFIEENQKYRFIIFIDDFSFNENEPQFKELKTILDGGLYQIPKNLLFYATSNRKNLIPIKFSDRDPDEKNIEENLQEKLSLAERFGLRIGFFKMSQTQYLQIVDYYAQKYNINTPKHILHQLAIRFALDYGRNGRTAYQFIKNLDY